MRVIDEESRITKMLGNLMKTRRRKIALILAASLATLLLFTVAILPIIVRNKAIAEIEKATGRKVQIESVSINPFTLTVGIKKFAVEERNNLPFISIGSLRASLSAASIYKLALIMDEVTIDAPSISITRTAPNRYNFSDIIERRKQAPKEKKKEKKGEFLFSINNINIKKGSLDFNDQAVEGGRIHTVRNFDLYLPFISNTAYLIEKYTAPKVSALVNGAPFNFAGKTKPLSKSVETSVHIDLKQLDLPKFAAYSPRKPLVNLSSGKLTINADVNYSVSADKKPELFINGLVRLDDIAVNLENGMPLVRVPSLTVMPSGLEVFTRQFKFEKITFDGPEMFVSRDANGEWMYKRLLSPPNREEMKPETGPEKKAETDAKEAQTLVKIASFAFSKGIVHFDDARPQGGFKGDVTDINIAVKNFTTWPDKSSPYELSLLYDNEAALKAGGSFSITPLTAISSMQITGLKLRKGWPYLNQFITSPVNGNLDISLTAKYSKDAGLTVEHAGLSVTGLSTRYGDKESFNLDSLEITEASFRQKENSLEVGEMKLAGGKLSLSREADGSFSILSLLRKPAAGRGDAADSPMTKGANDSNAGNSDASPLSYLIKSLQISSFNTAFTDKTREDKPRFTLKKTALSLSDLKGPKFTPAKLRFNSIFNDSSPLSLNGNITPKPFRYKGSISVRRLPLRDFEAYFPSNVNIIILNGLADTAMNVDIALKEDKPNGSFKGSAGIRSFHAVDAVAEEDLFKWESLQFEDIQGNLSPLNIALGQIALNSAYMRVIVREDGTLNLQNLVQKEEKKADVQNNLTSEEIKPAEQQETATGKKQISIDAVTIQDGTISFTDNHLPQHFDTTFFNLGGRVSGMSSEETKFADVDLRGNLENQSPLQITGQINPLRDDLFVDLKVSFRDIELSPLTPYSSTYLGYTVEKGKLYLDLKYHIEKKELNSENKIFIDQFTFGEKVESKMATSLPVKLGLALLQDRNGEIHLDVPVTGRTDEPKFSIWRLVFQVLKNLLVKAVTAPFSLLSSMFGGGEDFNTVQFSSGTSKILPEEEQKLNNLSKALLERPALKIEIKGYVDSEKDAEGYRLELLDRKLRNEKILALSKERKIKEGESAETMQVLPEEYKRYLTAVYRKEKFAKPRNFIGLVKSLPPDEMKKLIIANTVIGEQEFQDLARERVVAVVNYLVNNGNVPTEQIFQVADDVFKSPEKEKIARSRVELNAIVQ